MFTLVVTAILTAPGVAPPQSPRWMVQVGLTGEQVGEWTNSLKARGYRPVGISAYNAVEANRYAVVYQKSAAPAWDMDWGRTPAQFVERARVLSAKGYFTACLSGCNQLGAERLSDLWVKQTGVVREATYGVDAADLVPQLNRMRSRGYRPMRISSYQINAANVFAVVWEKGGPTWELKYGLSGQALQEAMDDLSARGYRPVSLGGLNAGGVVRYCAVWEKRKGPAWDVRYAQTQDDFLTIARSMAARGFRPTAVVGYNTPQGDRFASLWEKDASGQ